MILNRALRILLISNALIILAGGLLGPLYALFVEDLGGTVLDAGLTFGVFALAAGITTLISGHYSDKLRNREIIVILGYCIMGFGFLMLLLVDSIWFLFLVQAIIGLGEAIYAPPFDALYSVNLDKGKEAFGWSAWEATYYFVAAIGGIAGGFLVFYFGFSPIFVIMGVLCFISAIFLHYLRKEFKDES